MPYSLLLNFVLSKPLREWAIMDLCNNVPLMCSCGSVVEHSVSSAKVVGSIPREHMYWQYKCITWIHCKSLWIKASAKCINVKFVMNSGFNETIVTMVAVMKKFHGSRVPRPRMKNMIHTALYLEDTSHYSLLSICFIWESHAQTRTCLVERLWRSLCLSDGSVTDLFQNLASNLKSHGDGLHSVIMKHNARRCTVSSFQTQ